MSANRQQEEVIVVVGEVCTRQDYTVLVQRHQNSASAPAIAVRLYNITHLLIKHTSSKNTFAIYFKKMHLPFTS
jgi:hypothetical protein